MLHIYLYDIYGRHADRVHKFDICASHMLKDLFTEYDT